MNRCFCGQKLPKGGVVVGIPIASLGVAIGCTGLAGHRTGTSEPFGRGPVSGDPGRITEGTNELFGEDLAVIHRLVPV